MDGGRYASSKVAVSASSSRRCSCCLYARATAPAGVNPEDTWGLLGGFGEGPFVRGEVLGRDADVEGVFVGRVE